MANEKIFTDCKERVAFEMADKLYHAQFGGQPFNLQNYFALYRKCYKAVCGGEVSHIMSED